MGLTDTLHKIDKRAEIYRKDFVEMKTKTAEFIARQGINATDRTTSTSEALHSSLGSVTNSKGWTGCSRS